MGSSHNPCFPSHTELWAFGVLLVPLPQHNLFTALEYPFPGAQEASSCLVCHLPSHLLPLQVTLLLMMASYFS